VISLLDQTSNHSVVDSAGSLLDLEESGHSPLGVPRVGAQPVRDTAFSSPSDDLDGVSSEGSSGGVDVNSTGVGQEVLVDGEGSLDGSVGEDLVLNLLNSGDGVGLGSEVEVRVVRSGVSSNASLGASGGGVGGERRALRVDGGVVVVLAGLEGVWLAEAGLVVQVSGDDSGVDVVSPGGRGVSSVAAASAEEAAAGEQVLGGDSGLQGLVGGDADSVGDGLDSTEGPARAAVGLISDLRDGLALGPLLSGIKVLRESGVDGSLLLLSQLEPLGLLQRSHHLLDVLEGSSDEVLVDSSSPGVSLDGVDVSNDRSSVLLEVESGLDSQTEQSNDENGLHE